MKKKGNFVILYICINKTSKIWECRIVEMALTILLTFGAEIVEVMYIEEVVLAFLSMFESTIFLFLLFINYYYISILTIYLLIMR